MTSVIIASIAVAAFASAGVRPGPSSSLSTWWMMRIVSVTIFVAVPECRHDGFRIEHGVPRFELLGGLHDVDGLASKVDAFLDQGEPRHMRADRGGVIVKKDIAHAHADAL